MYLLCILSVHIPIQEYLDSIQLFAMVNNAIINIFILTSFYTYARVPDVYTLLWAELHASQNSCL